MVTATFGHFRAMSKMSLSSRSLKIHNLNSPLEKLHLFCDFQNMPGSCRFGAKNCTFEPHAKCSYQADLVFTTNAITETLVYVAPERFPMRHPTGDRFLAPETSEIVSFGIDSAHTHTHTAVYPEPVEVRTGDDRGVP